MDFLCLLLPAVYVHTGHILDRLLDYFAVPKNDAPPSTRYIYPSFSPLPSIFLSLLHLQPHSHTLPLSPPTIYNNVQPLSLTLFE